MNKKTMTIVSGTAGLVLGLSACGTETYDYEVSGAVQAQQLDYDCPGEDIAMDAVAFVSGSGRGSSGGSGGRSSSSGGSGKSSNKSDSGSSSSNKDSGSSSSDKKKSGSSGSGKKSSGTSDSNSNSSSGSSGSSGSSSKNKPSAKPVKNSGVKLSKKPEKAEKLKGKKVPKLKYKIKPKGCETEYEIFVLADDGNLYEQDVRQDDYNKCAGAKVPKGLKNKLFPLCTKG